MFKAIISFSLENKLFVGLGVLALVVSGIFSATQIPLDAVPDITNNQVQIVTTAPTFAPEEMEQLITYPLEAGLTNIPDVVEVRSISRYGLSVITVVFEEFVEVMLARQFVQEQLNVAKAELPDGVEPELMPITTGLGEIYQYVLTVDKAYAHLYDATELRTIQDWMVKRQLNGTPGIIETSSFGGYLKQYEVAVDPVTLKNFDLNIQDVIAAITANNENSGGSYIEKDQYSFYIRTEGRTQTMEEIGSIPITLLGDVPVLVKDVAEVRIGSAKRYGAMTMDGKGEVVGGITLMLKGGNSSEALKKVKDRIAIIQETLPEGVSIYPYLDRSKLIGKTIETASNNLIEGGVIVILVLLLLLGNFRAGLIVASVIPISMLFVLTCMNIFGVSANLMSLGAIDFGVVIDGAVIIVEGLLGTLALGYVGMKLTQAEMDHVVKESSSQIYRSAAFGVLIILIVFVPILTLEGTEGKTFRPMAQTVGFAILGSLILSLTYVPVMSSLFLKREIKAEKGIAHRIIQFLKSIYRPILGRALNQTYLTIGLGVIAFVVAMFIFSRMGAEFIPTLEEGDIAMQQAIKPGSSLEESIHTSTLAESILLENFPEVEHVVSKIGTAEVPTDPMAIEDADIMIILKDKEMWTSANDREGLITLMKEKLAPITWASFEFTQPIQLRFNELMTGAKSDISIKIFGEDVEMLKEKGDEIAGLIADIQGVGDVKVDQTDGLRQLSIQYDRAKMAQYGLSIQSVNQVIRAAYAGEKVGNLYEEERKFDVVVRLAPDFRQQLDIDQLTIQTAKGFEIPISQIARVVERESPMLISREQARRFINIGVNVRNRDVASLVEDIQVRLGNDLRLSPGYEIQYGGQFENLENARRRLLIAVPIALGLILLLLYMAFNSMKEVLIIFMAVPLSAIGGVLALYFRGMPFSISSGIGFIALFGIAVLNSIVLINAIKHLDRTQYPDLKALIMDASTGRLRPVLITALTDALGFLPMAVSMGNGAEVQRPLATVVIGGLISATLLTLIVLPALYRLFFERSFSAKPLMAIALVVIGAGSLQGQTFSSFDEIYSHALSHHPELKNVDLEIQSTALEKQAVGQWGPLSVDYQGGQINERPYDHLFSVNQDVSHLFGRKAQMQVVASRVNQVTHEKILLANDLRYTLWEAYDLWRFQEAKLAVIDSILQLYEEVTSVVDIRDELGESSPLSTQVFYQKILAYQQTLSVQNQEVIQAKSNILTLAYLPADVALIPTELVPLPLDSFSLDRDKSIYLETYKLKQQVLAATLKSTEKQSKQPNLSVGYFLQSLEKAFAFQGVSIGVGIPLDRRRAKTTMQQNQLAQQQITHQQEGLLHKYESRISHLRQVVFQIQTTINQFQNNLLPRQANIRRIATLQFESGEIDILAFNQIQRDLLETRLEYLSLIKQYNSAILELTYLTQKNN